MIIINKEEKYILEVNKDKQKKYGQHFTPPKIAEVMAKWVGKNSSTALDPAYGNGIFFRYMKKYYKDIRYTGFEIDYGIVSYFGMPKNDNIYIDDFLLSEFTKKYDSIICNPPYNKFQSIDNRQEIKKHFYDSIGISITGYTNQYIYFLVKCIYQLKQKGRLAFIVPTEFLNSKYGKQVKELLIEKRLLKSVINLDFDVFKSALTTSCILLIEKRINDSVEFVNINNLEELSNIDFDSMDNKISKSLILYEELSPHKKWTEFLYNEDTVSNSLSNITTLDTFANVSRGIATGSNEFFLLNKEKVEKYGIESKYLTPCISKSSYIQNPFFCENHMLELINSNKDVFLLDIKSEPDLKLREYLKIGIMKGIDKKYLTSKRTPWYSMEQKKSAPILLSSAFRDNIKIIKNINLSKNLTTFHSLRLIPEFEKYEDIIFCYLLTDIGQSLLKENKKVMGGGLNKFQPNDYNSAKVLDLRILSKNDINQIRNLYKELSRNYDEEIIITCDKIFRKYT